MHEAAIDMQPPPLQASKDPLLKGGGKPYARVLLPGVDVFTQLFVGRVLHS